MSKTYKIHINERTCSSWEIFEMETYTKVELDINPLESKLFTNDVFKLDKHGKPFILHSSIRSGPPMPGVLVLDGNKTYGRERKLIDGQTYTRNKAKLSAGRLLYKCIPDDLRLPPFLVPYEMKSMGFSKVFKNLYVLINYEDWDDKHPRAKLDNVIGPVDILDNFYEYQLFCKSLNASIQKFQKSTIKALETKSQDTLIDSILKTHPSIEDRTDQNRWHIITIDPLNSQDFDDGFSLTNSPLDNGEKILSIYISNVTIWMDVLNLWSSFSRRISTIYLPDKKRPMLPTILSDCLCSLQANVKRIAFVMDVHIRDEEIVNIQFKNAIIKVMNNYVYEDAKLLSCDKYHEVMEVAQSLTKKYRYINNIKNSHDLIAYLMILMNYHCAKEMVKHKTGIFRSTIIKREFHVPDTVPDDVSKFIKIWNSAAGQYIDGTEIIDSRHELLDVDAYIHISSPIRRLVDLLNMIKFQSILGVIELTEDAHLFYEKWLNEMEYINTTMRSIRKVQCDCSLLDLCHNNPDVMEKEYVGYLFDKIYRNDGLYQYVVFLPELKLSSRITLRDDFANFDRKQFKLYLFNDEVKFKRKIRLQILV